jgi:hypothetical protein
LTEYVKSLNEAFKFSVSLILKVRILKKSGSISFKHLCRRERKSKSGSQRRRVSAGARMRVRVKESKRERK